MHCIQDAVDLQPALEKAVSLLDVDLTYPFLLTYDLDLIA
jgi:hypothetical protein